MRVRIHNMDLFYEKEGHGPPLILLHGNGEDHHIFDQAAGELSARWTVYRPDSRGHGENSRERELHYDDLAEDMIAFIQTLKIKKPVFYGFSDGGIIGLLIASREPELLSGLVISGANLYPRGLKPFFYWMYRFLNFFRRKAEWDMMLTEPSIRKNHLEKIVVPVYVTAGARDAVREPHTRFIAEHIQRSRLDIQKGENHASYVTDGKKLINILEKGIAFIKE